MGERFPGGVISKTPPTVTPPVAGEGGSASGLWSLTEVLDYEKAGAWPKPLLPRELYAWGDNASGQVGDSSVESRSSPVQVDSSITWSSVSLGRDAAFGIKRDNTLWSWGLNSSGQLGLGNTINRSSPVQVGALTNWAQVGSGFLAVHAAAVKTDNTLWAWGRNDEGQIGQNTVFGSPSSPVQVGTLADWAQVSANSNSTLAVKTNGTLWGWGNNADGQLGDGTVTRRSSPVQIGALTGWSRVSSGGTQSVAIRTNGTLWAWGRGASGQLGDNTVVSKSSPVQIGALTTWSQASSGETHTLAVRTNNTLWSWGSASSGRLGNNSQSLDLSSPVQVGSLTDWSSVSAGRSHSLSTKTNGTLWSWGSNNNGQLGDNTVANKSSPVQVGSLTNWLQVSGGEDATAAITRG
jgi:alpha-tubulin suppressor-like RCC1 family protein